MCELLNAVQQFGFPSSHHLSQICQPSSYSFFLLPTETLMDSRWATTELAWTTFPESGVSKCVHVFNFFFFFFVPPPFFFCSICLLVEPSLPWTAHLLLFYSFVFFFLCMFAFSDTKILGSKWETHRATLCGRNQGFSVFRNAEELDEQIPNYKQTDEQTCRHTRSKSPQCVRTIRYAVPCMTPQDREPDNWKNVSVSFVIWAQERITSRN